MSQVAMNDHQSLLTKLISCVECAKTMRIERIDPDGDGKDMIQYRCEHCGRIERLRLIRRTWLSAAETLRADVEPRARSQNTD
jgi:hypothetical protein